MRQVHPAPGQAPGRFKTPPVPPRARAAKKATRPQNRTALLLFAGGALILVFSAVAALVLGLLLVLGSGRILPGVAVGSTHLGGLTLEEATAQLAADYAEITVRDGERLWRVPAMQLGLRLDAAATAENARQYGRGSGSVLAGLFGGVSIAPVFSFSLEAALPGVEALVPVVELPARNATVRLVEGGLMPVPAASGRQLLVNDTLARLASLATDLADGAFELAMADTMPTVTDATPLVAQMQALLASPLTINAYNPVTDETLPWSIPVELWSQWITTESAAEGLTVSVDGASLAGFLRAREAELSDGRSLHVEEAVERVQQAVWSGVPSATIRVYNGPTTYTVRSGETLGTISWAVGVQMYRIAAANPGVNMEALYPGEEITIPSRDDLLPLPIVPNKRIVVSIGEQRMRVYDDGAVIWNWPASTGIADSPTLPGVYQVISHDGTAYAGNWNLYMPHFMSIYEAIPGFFNGIHGFPWRDGYQILWEGSLGTRVTYGCILISSDNARLLYEWAEDGVVTEIQP